jgi:lysophospholipase L1-like esterase
LPLVLTDLFPEVEATDIGPAPDCDVPDIAQHVASAASAIIPQLVDPVTEEFGFFHGRLDPAIDVHNVAVGGSMVGDALNGPNPENFGLLFMSHLTYEPYADLFDPVLESQLDRIEALGATIVISADLFGNDLILPLVTAGKLSENPPTPGEVIAQNIRGVIERLAKLDAIVFLANLPHPSLLPARVQKRLEYVRRATEGLEGEARREAEEAALREADVALAEIDAATQEANWVLADAASDHPNIHVVDLLGAVESVGPQGLEVGGSTLTLGRFGGLIGLDGVHFSDTGYALVANLFVEKISEVLGTDLEPLDLEAIHQNDADSPEALAADGLDPDCFEAL